jgi:hypothetical protein
VQVGVDPTPLAPLPAPGGSTRTEPSTRASRPSIYPPAPADGPAPANDPPRGTGTFSGEITVNGKVMHFDNPEDFERARREPGGPAGGPFYMLEPGGPRPPFFGRRMHGPFGPGGGMMGFSSEGSTSFQFSVESSGGASSNGAGPAPGRPTTGQPDTAASKPDARTDR